MRDSTSAWPSGESFGAFTGCCACGGAATPSVLRRFDGEKDAAAETKAARRANSRREIVESLLLPIESPCDQRKRRTISEWRRVRLLNPGSSVNWPRGCGYRDKKSETGSGGNHTSVRARICVSRAWLYCRSI